MTTDDRLLEKLLAAARAACGHAYAPYSAFRVGAACLTASGRIFSGANVENASYGLAICAERAAIFNAIGAGDRDLRAIAIYTPTAKPVSPCGACRQVICEFGSAIEIVASCDAGTLSRWTSVELLPDRFSL